MGAKLADFLAKREAAEKTPLMNSIAALLAAAQKGTFPPTIGNRNAVLDLLKQPLLESESFVEIEEGETWRDLLEQFKHKHHSEPSAKPFEASESVRSLRPDMRPGIYQIFTWSDPSREGDTSMEEVARIFGEKGARGLYAPALKYLTQLSSIGSLYGAQLSPWEIEAGVGEAKKAPFVVWGYQETWLRFRTRWNDGGAGKGLYIGAKFVE